MLRGRESGLRAYVAALQTSSLPSDPSQLHTAQHRGATSQTHVTFFIVCVSVALGRVQLCDPMDRSPLGSSVHGVLQARILEWGAISFSEGNLPNPGIEPVSPALAGGFFTTEPPGKPHGDSYSLLGSVGRGLLRCGRTCVVLSSRVGPHSWKCGIALLPFLWLWIPWSLFCSNVELSPYSFGQRGF